MGDDASVFHSAFLKPGHANFREDCRDRYLARERSLKAKSLAKNRLYAALPILFRDVQVIRFMWYRLAVVANLLPDGLADFLSLARQQQEELLENIRRVRRESEQAPWSFLVVHARAAGALKGRRRKDSMCIGGRRVWEVGLQCRPEFLARVGCRCLPDFWHLLGFFS